MTDETTPRRRGTGRPPGFNHLAATRERIKVGMIVTRLHKHIEGMVEMSSTQLRAAEILLRKALPDLASVEHTGEIRTRNVTDLTDAELLNIAAGRSARVDTAADGEDESRGVYRLLDS